MKREDISNAVGNISTRHIQEADNYLTQKGHKRSPFKKIVGLVAALVLCFTLAIPILATADMEPAYEILYALFPKVAQTLKPVRISCEDKGIRMEVISANIKDDRAEIYISMQDMTGERIDETIDLFDSYSINRPFSSSATCQRVSYDEVSKRATFLISITQWGQKKIGGEKVTFAVDKFLSNKQEYHDIIPQIDLSTATLTPQTQSNVQISGWSSQGNHREEPGHTHYLRGNFEEAFSPVDGVRVTGIGFIDEKLHIQAYYENILETDNHGFFSLAKVDGNEIACETSVSFWDSERKGSYEEYIFDVSPDEIDEYKLYGDFWTCGTLIRGNWQVTFPLTEE